MQEPWSAHASTLTMEEYRRLPDGGRRCELVRGRVVKEPQPGFEHGRIQARLIGLLTDHIRRAGLDMACVGPVGFVLERDPPTVRAPDVAVVRRSRVPPRDPGGFIEGAPELAVEIVSPSNTAAAIQEKIRDYLTAGAVAVWVVYPRSRTVAVHEGPSSARHLEEGEMLNLSNLVPALQLEVAEVFGE